MNLPHLHILLNHVPTVGFSVGLALFVVALLGKSDDLKRASLSVVFVIAVISTAVYCSGSAAEAVICTSDANCRPGVIRPAIVAHENAALLAYMVMQGVGALSFLGLWQMRRRDMLSSGLAAGILALSAFAFVMMARAATIGGEIRHPEILESNDAPAPAAAAPVEEAPAKSAAAGEPEGKPAEKAEKKVAAAAPAPPPPEHFEIDLLKAATIRAFVKDNNWVWPACETIHFIGLSLLFTVVFIVDLRLLGMVRIVPFSALHKMLPWGMLGFGINLVTGMMFFVAAREQYVNNVVFFWKIVLIVLAGFNVLYFLFFDQVWAVGSGDDAPLATRLAAASAIILWVGVLFCGHMLPFLGTSF